MQGGCFKSLLASVGCLTLLLAIGVVAWIFRAQVAGLYRSVAGEPPAAPAETPVIDVAVDTVPRVGRPTNAAAHSARAKQEAMAERDGPPYVVLTADELASLIRDGLDPVARRALDSVEVTLQVDRFELRGQVRTALIEAMLGPFAGMLAAREPLVLGGPARVTGVGVVAWEPDSVLVRAFPLPRAAIPVLINRLTGGKDGSLRIGVPATVGDLRIRPSGVTFYRRVQ